MNIGILTLTILVLFSPGFFFRRGYYSGVFSKQYFKQNIIESILWTIIPSIIFHVTGYVFFIHWDFQIDFKVLAILLSTTSDTSELQFAFQQIFNFFGSILSYFTIISILAFLSGLVWKHIIREYFLDSRFKILRFRNYWHYIFTGEILNFPNIPGDPVDTNSAYLDLICTIGNENYIYRGFLLDYQLSKEHELESIALFGVKRRRLGDDNSQWDLGKDPYYTIKGQFIVFKYDEIKHINVTYYNLEEVEEENALSKQLIITNTLLKKGWFLFHLGWIITFMVLLNYLVYLSSNDTIIFSNQSLDGIIVPLIMLLFLTSINNNQLANAYGKLPLMRKVPGLIIGLVGTIFAVFIANKILNLYPYQTFGIFSIIFGISTTSGMAKGWLASLIFTIIGVCLSLLLLYMVESPENLTFYQVLAAILLGVLVSAMLRILIIINNFKAYWKDKFLRKV